tara:strand:+ start:5231 stop:5851 length:621 start_codon:yes stop_codon:yes gene_type:complete
LIVGMRLIIILLFSLASIYSQTNRITSIDIASKMNGISINIHSDLILNPNQVTGWFNESTSWYYMTIHQANGDTASLELTKLVNSIKKVEVIKAGESLQIGFRMRVPVENFEFYFSDVNPEFITALRFPLSDVIASLESNQLDLENNIIYKTKNKPIWLKVFYFVGIGLATSGIIAGEGQKGWEAPIGMGMITVAYVYDNFITKRN